MFADDGVVVHKKPSRFGGELERYAARHVIENVANKVDRTAEYRLRTVTAMRRVNTAVIEDADIVDAAVGFDKVIAEHMQVVVVNINGGGPPLRILFRRSVRRDADRVVKLRNRIARDHMPRTVDFNTVVALHLVRAVNARAHDPRISPTDQAHPIHTAKEQ